MTIGIIIDGGVVQRVLVDGETLEGHEVIVIANGEPEKLIFASLDVDSIIGVEVKRIARDKSACFVLGTAAEVASEAFLELSRRDYECPVAMLADFKAVLAGVVSAAEQVRAGMS